MKIISNLLKTYSSLSVIKKSVIWYTAATILQKGVVFLTTPIYTRMLSDSQYGLYNVYQSWLQIVSVISVIALDRCVTVGFMKFENDRMGFLSVVQFLMTLTVTFSALLVFLFSGFFERLFGLPLIITIAMLIVALLSNALANWSWYQRYEYNYNRLVVVTITFTLITQLFSIAAVVFMPFTNKGEILILSTSVSMLLLYGAVYVSVFFNGKVLVKKKYLAFALPYSIAVVPHALAQIILNSSDRIMIDKLCGRTEAAYYGVTYSAAMALNIIMISVSSSFQPWIFKKIKCGDFRSIREKTNYFLLFTAALSVIVSLFAPEVLMILAPASYRAALWIFPSVAASVFFNSVYLCFANFESYYEKPFYFSVATITGASVNIVLNFIFIPIFGFVAAGYTTLICYMLFAVMHYVFMRKVCREKLDGVKVFDMRFIVGLSILVMTLSIGVTATYGYPFYRYALIAVGLVLCAIKREFIKNHIRNVILNK
ncbi:lipopolysaccharide biosynthesis protein [Sporolactobacillus terrae]|uniref:Polysaccharide biosynthesis protein C-terminal domain-containing protein n=1 Tax=Sporolactobacillus terrae TaxID=269673 RepID=A0ABX5Q4L2_9BACL|nr:oligosaccharide flippase family protein [Sporolactobacillus terrae]QAA21582.1 hypothetical protein C0674_02485 [Sporolactobacillus terrae]QAA24554.1 hypothetical protein C0679_02465 [Sporolactobacillus terrae]